MVSGRFKHITFKLISCCAAQFLPGPDWHLSEAWRLGTPALEHTCAPSWTWNSYFLLNSKGPKETCNQENSVQQQLDLGVAPDPSPGLPFL